MKIAFSRLFQLFLLSVFLCFAICTSAQNSRRRAANNQRSYIALKVYHAKDDAQLANINQYFQSLLLPRLEKAGFTNIGAFRAIDNDTAKDKRYYLLIPVPSLAQLQELTNVVDNSVQDSTQVAPYTNAKNGTPSFTRIETILLRAFEGMPMVKKSGAEGNADEKVYELRSYESASEALHHNKVKMFNSGEVTLFDRLGFNAVFYGQVMAGGRMPNLMYMTSFPNKASRDEHWKAFSGDAEWKALSAKPEFQNNVSKIDITFLRPLPYSKL